MMGTYADVVCVYSCSFVRLKQMLLTTSVAIERSSTPVARLGGWAKLWRLGRVRTVILQTGWTMIWVGGAGVLTFSIIRLQATPAELAG